MDIKSIVNAGRNQISSAPIRSLAETYLQKLHEVASAEPAKFVHEGAAVPPWIVFNDRGRALFDARRNDVVSVMSSIAPKGVSIYNSGTCVCMAPVR